MIHIMYVPSGLPFLFHEEGSDIDYEHKEDYWFKWSAQEYAEYLGMSIPELLEKVKAGVYTKEHYSNAGAMLSDSIAHFEERFCDEEFEIIER